MQVNEPADMTGKTIQKTFTVARGEDVCKALGVPVPHDGLLAYASVEIMDTAGDVVKVDGIKTSEYHNPPNSYMKILAQHLKVLPNGESPVIGRVEEFYRTTTPDGTKALAFRMSWAKDGTGNLKPLAAAYKADFDGGYMDSFSVGMVVDEYQPIKEGGYSLDKTTLTEISAVTVPANRLANVVRALDEHVEMNHQLLSQVKSLEEKIQTTCKAIKDMESSIIIAIQKFDDRFDYIESTLVATKSEASPVTGSRTNGEVHNDSVQILKSAVSKLNKVITR